MRNPFRKISPAEMLARQLDETQRDLILASLHVEAHLAHKEMLEKRRGRIKADLKALTESVFDDSHPQEGTR